MIVAYGTAMDELVRAIGAEVARGMAEQAAVGMLGLCLERYGIGGFGVLKALLRDIAKNRAIDVSWVPVGDAEVALRVLMATTPGELARARQAIDRIGDALALLLRMVLNALLKDKAAVQIGSEP
jgi:hypothetical protein